MRVVKLKKSSLKKLAREAKSSLEKGNLVVVPSDTAYGLAANANSSEAVKKIFAFKGRRFGKGVSVFLNNIQEIKKYAHLNKNQEEIIKTLLPGPFTVILRSRQKTAPEIEPGDKTIGIRVINHPFIKKLTKILKIPLTATSANISGKGPHYSTDSFLKTLSSQKKKLIDLVISQGRLPKRPTSTVIRLVKEKLEVLRKGVFNPKILRRYLTKEERETKRTARKIFSEIFKKELKDKSVVVILEGDLGTGKTVFAKGIGEVYHRQFTSPTFVLMDEYLINQEPVKKIYHLDLYRLETEKEVSQLKIERLLQKGNLILIEWGERLSVFQKLKKEDSSFFWVQIKKEKKDQRKITLYRV